MTITYTERSVSTVSYTTNTEMVAAALVERATMDEIIYTERSINSSSYATSVSVTVTDMLERGVSTEFITRTATITYVP
jgi:hypothetical protein